MKLFYFPFTYIPQQVRTDLAALFDELLYFPLTGMSAGGVSRRGRAVDPEAVSITDAAFLKPISIPPEMHRQALQAMAAHREWATGTGAGPGRLRFLAQKTPFFTSDAQISSINAQIRTGTLPAAVSTPSREETLMNALLFLSLAGEQDEQKASVDAAWQAVNRKKEHLFATLAGEGSCGTGEQSHHADASTDPGQLMTDARIRAWCRLFQSLAAPGPDAPFILVTTSPAVMDAVEKISQNSELLLDNGIIKAQKETEDHQKNKKVPSRDPMLKAFLEATGIPGDGGACGQNTDRLGRAVTLCRFHGEKLEKRFCPVDENEPKPSSTVSVQKGIGVCLVNLWK